ncbi:MAG: DUF5993 family protein [Pseudonocardiaceae bacterium]
MDTILMLAIFGIFVAAIKKLSRLKLISLWAVATVVSLLIFAHHAVSALDLNF